MWIQRIKRNVCLKLTEKWRQMILKIKKTINGIIENKIKHLDIGLSEEIVLLNEMELNSACIEKGEQMIHLKIDNFSELYSSFTKWNRL